MEFVYTGPSWAASSYPISTDSTNLAKEWNIPHIDFSKSYTSILKTVDALKQADNNLPIIWLYGEPCVDVKRITGMSFVEFCEHPNWYDIREQCNQACLKEIASLQQPVLLIGSHSDVINCNYPNIRIGHSSWQKWVAGQAGLPVNDNVIYVKMDDGGDFVVQNCWGGEIVQKYIHEHPELTVNSDLSNKVWDMYFFWKELSKRDWFFDVHPNIKANKKFAQFLLPEVIKFLNL